jgi:hypothetical protein
MFRWDPRAGPTWIHEIFAWDPTFWFVGPTILLRGISFFDKPKPRGPLIASHLQQNLGRQIARRPGWFKSIHEARGSAVFKKSLALYRN